MMRLMSIRRAMCPHLQINCQLFEILAGGTPSRQRRCSRCQRTSSITWKHQLQQNCSATFVKRNQREYSVVTDPTSTIKPAKAIPNNRDDQSDFNSIRDECSQIVEESRNKGHYIYPHALKPENKTIESMPKHVTTNKEIRAK